MHTLNLDMQHPQKIATITFNRPMAMKSLNDEMASEFLQLIDEVEKNKEIRVVILQGAGDQFMAGGDIGFFYQNCLQ